MTLVSRPVARFWAYALSPVGFLAIAFVVLLYRGTSLPAASEFARYSGLPELALPVVVILAIIFSGYGEELGWRGFALDRLQARFGPLGGSLVLAALWAGWHLPAFGFVQTYREMALPMIVGGFLLGITCGSIVLARVVHQTGGSVLAAALWHATYNLTSATSAGGGMISAVTTACVMIWAFILVGREWRRPQERSLLSFVAIPRLG
jgi:membrane protease YdiL (CAAX protease family)